MDRLINILMADNCTKKEAEKHIKRGSIVFEAEDFEENLENYMEEWEVDEEEQAEYRKMVEEKKPMNDWGIAEYEGKRYYIMYCL